VSDLKREMIKIVKELYKKNILDTQGGNISAREGDSIFVTRRESSSEKHWDLSEADIIETDLLGKAKDPQMQQFITRESRTHYRILNEISDIKAVFHVHSQYLLAFASLKISLPIVTALAWSQGFPKYVQYIKDEPAVSVKEAEATTRYFKYLYNKNPNGGFACLLAGHGAVVGGKSLTDAFTKLHTLENNARTFLYMEIIKSSNHYNEARTSQLDDMFDSWVDIQHTPIKKLELYFEKEGVEF
jgi:ribulose-5-phosphate 4-epimerase/fuculose-1-phosphate aldolase